jgi:hypothetical protein
VNIVNVVYDTAINWKLQNELTEPIEQKRLGNFGELQN